MDTQTYPPSGHASDKDSFSSSPSTSPPPSLSPPRSSPARSMTASEPPAASKHRGIFFLFVLFAHFQFSFDIPLVANIRPKIIADLGEIDKLPILSVVYSMALTSTNLVWGYNYRNFHFRIVFCLAVGIFEIGSAVCGSAPTMNALIVGRAICGMGGGGMLIGTLTYINLSTTLQERPKFLGVVGAVYSIAAILGPIIGGAFADSPATWRWAFYLCLLLGALGAPVYLTMLPNIDPRKDDRLLQRFSRFDILGFTLFLGLFTTWTLFPSFGGSIWAWGDGRTIALIVVCATCLLAFIAQQYFCIGTNPTNRFFPAHLLRNWEILVIFAQMCCAMTALYIPLYFIPLNLQFVRGDSALLAGVKLLPFIGVGSVLVLVSGALMARGRPIYTPYYLVGSIFVLVGGVLLHFDSYGRSAAYPVGCSVLVGFVGLYIQLGFGVAQGKVPTAEIPAATALLGFAQVGAVDVALVIGNSIFLNQAVDKLHAVLPGVPRGEISHVISGSGSALLGSLAPSVRKTAFVQILAAISQVYLMVVVAGASSLLLALVMLVKMPARLERTAEARQEEEREEVGMQSLERNHAGEGGQNNESMDA